MQDRATSAAVIELNFDALRRLDDGLIHDIPGLEGYRILDVGFFNEDTDNPKVITLRDPQNNIIVHFNGTGDGNWEHNNAAFGAPPQPSEMQRWAADYFDGVYRDIIHDMNADSDGKIYVTGHSQGGNNAQFVLMHSDNRDRIESCIAIDAPGFSFQFERDFVEMYGRDEFNRLRGRIWAYNGTHDFVNQLGQIHLFPEDQVFFINQYGSTGIESLYYFHHISGRFQRKVFGFTIVDGPSEFSLLIAALNGQIRDLPPGQQERVAFLAMKLAEDLSGVTVDGEQISNIRSYMSQEELSELLRFAAPLLLDFLANNPDLIGPVLTELFGLDPAAAALIGRLLETFNDLSPEDRHAAIAALLNMLTIDENGEFSLDANFKDIVDAIIAAWPAIIESVFNGDLQELLKTLGIDVRFLLLLGETPLKVVLGIVVVIILVISIYRWISNAWNARGRSYAETNPEIRVNTDDLRSFASRIDNVNRRIGQFDSDLNGLARNVRLRDLPNLILTDLMTSQSTTLSRVSDYLNNAAQSFEQAERDVRTTMGG